MNTRIKIKLKNMIAIFKHQNGYVLIIISMINSIDTLLQN